MLIRPVPLPDELAEGYKGRVMRWNGIADPTKAMQLLLAWSGNAGASRRKVSSVELLARAAGIDTQQFVRIHTTLPLRRAVVTEWLEVPHGSPDHESLLWTIALRESRPGAYFCIQCVEEDFGFHGTPYWRREHQLPGHYCCEKHKVPLRFVDRPCAFLSSPTAYLDAHHAIAERWSAQIQASGPIQRFLAITSDLLARAKPLDERDVSRAAGVRARELGMHTGRGAVRRDLVSDLIKKQFDSDWLASVVPGLADQPQGQFWQPVDAAVNGKRVGIGSTVYALVFAALFESADAAVNAMVTPVLATKPAEDQQPRASCVGDAELRAAYTSNGGSHCAVAAQFSINQHAASKRLNDLGLPPLGGAAARRLKNVIQAVVLERLPLLQAAARFDVPLAEIESLIQIALTPLTSALSPVRGSRRKRTWTPRPRSIAPSRLSPVFHPAIPLSGSASIDDHMRSGMALAEVEALTS